MKLKMPSLFLRRQPREKGFLFSRLREALNAEGCALCHLAERESRQHLEMLFHEGIMDPGVREKLLQSDGFCNWHAWMATQIPFSPAGIAIVYQELLDKIRKSLSTVPKTPSQTLQLFRRDPARKSSPNRECPVCEWAHSAENLYLSDLIEFFDDPKINSAFAASLGLCLPHLQMAVNDFRNHPKLPRLLEAEEKKLATLQAELAEFDRKRDYRFANEPTGTERNSWRRVIEIFTGKRGVFPRTTLQGKRSKW